MTIGAIKQYTLIYFINMANRKYRCIAMNYLLFPISMVVNYVKEFVNDKW